MKLDIVSNLDSIRGIIRPIIAISGWLTILGAFIYVLVKFLDQEMAGNIATGVLVLITAAVNSYIGSRKPSA